MKSTILTLSAILLATASFADDGRGGKMGRGGHHGMGPRPEFSELDTNADGQVTAEEIQAFHAAKFAEADTNGDGQLTADEMMAARDKAREDRVLKMIEKQDADGSGGLSQDEMPQADDEEDRAAHMLERMDENGDGSISEEEFANAGPRGKHGKGK